MRWAEIAGGYRIILDEEQQELLTLIGESKLAKRKMNERQVIVANKMVTKGLLNRLREDDHLYYQVNRLQDAWRI